MRLFIAKKRGKIEAERKLQRLLFHKSWFISMNIFISFV